MRLSKEQKQELLEAADSCAIRVGYRKLSDNKRVLSAREHIEFLTNAARMFEKTVVSEPRRMRGSDFRL